MTNRFFYEDGQGHVVDERGCPEPMDYVVDEGVHALETVSTRTEHLHNVSCQHNSGSVATYVSKPKDTGIRMGQAESKRVYTNYTGQDKERFFKLMFEKVLSASAAAKLLGIHIRSAQRWALQCGKDPDSIFQKHEKGGRLRILSKQHKKVILECIDENPSIVLEQLMARLLQSFEGLKFSKTTFYRFVKEGCNLTLKKASLSTCRQEKRSLDSRTA